MSSSKESFTFWMLLWWIQLLYSREEKKRSFCGSPLWIDGGCARKEQTGFRSWSRLFLNSSYRWVIFWKLSNFIISFFSILFHAYSCGWPTLQLIICGTCFIQIHPPNVKVLRSFSSTCGGLKLNSRVATTWNVNCSRQCQYQPAIIRWPQINEKSHGMPTSAK